MPLWARCRTEDGSHGGALARVAQALRAADLVLAAGSFGAIVLDLGDAPAAALSQVPPATWHRLRCAVLGTPTALLVLAQAPCARSCAALALRTGGSRPLWDTPRGEGAAPTLLHGMHFTLACVRGRHRRPAEPDPRSRRTHAVWNRTAAWAR